MKRFAALLTTTILISGSTVALAEPITPSDSAFRDGQTSLQTALKRAPNNGKAKNIVLFIGDGMGINSVTAGRIMAGQTRGLDGASYSLSFDAFPYTALSKTYAVDALVTDSANGISAITTGFKTINGAIGVNGKVRPKDCATGLANRVSNIAEQAKRKGLLAGVVTTSALTDATPAGVYGHTASRDWQADTDMPDEVARAGCTDLARQLVEAPDNVRLDVALGGGAAKFLPKAAGTAGARSDDRDLTKLWRTQTSAAKFVTTARDLNAVETKNTNSLLGIFAPSHLPSVIDHDKFPDTPTLAEMTSKAIEVLSKNPKGYVLLVESASIDKWHHRNNAYRALTDVDELSKAVAVAVAKSDPAETLIIVTADHSHALAVSGYATREADILGLARQKGVNQLDKTGKPRTILSYASGPGEQDHEHELTQAEAVSPDFLQPALVPLSSAAHGGEDVPVYAYGPQAHLISGTVESSYIYHVMAYALSLSED